MPRRPKAPAPAATEAPAPAERVPTEAAAPAAPAVQVVFAPPPAEPSAAPGDAPEGVPADAGVVPVPASAPGPYAKRRAEAAARVQALLDKIAARGWRIDYEAGVVPEARTLLLMALAVEHKPCPACGHRAPRLDREEAEAREFEAQAGLLDREYQVMCTRRDLEGLRAVQALAPAPPTPAGPGAPAQLAARRAAVRLGDEAAAAGSRPLARQVARMAGAATATPAPAAPMGYGRNARRRMERLARTARRAS